MHKYKRKLEERIAKCKIDAKSINKSTLSHDEQGYSKVNNIDASQAKIYDDYLIPEIPPPLPLLPKQLQIITEPIRFGVRVDSMKLSTFKGVMPEKEKADTQLVDPPKHPPKPSFSNFLPTLKTHLLKELQTKKIVYERIYPGSLPVTQRKSLFFTELCNVKRLLRDCCVGEPEEFGDAVFDQYMSRLMLETELPPYPLDSSLSIVLLESFFVLVRVLGKRNSN